VVYREPLRRHYVWCPRAPLILFAARVQGDVRTINFKLLSAITCAGRAIANDSILKMALSFLKILFYRLKKDMNERIRRTNWRQEFLKLSDGEFGGSEN
jgi:hypothetical protein